MDDEQSRTLFLAHQAWPFLDQPLPSGANDTEIDAFSERAAMSVPEELRVWLRLCNGAVIGPGGVYGLREMEREYQWHPEWKERGWIAVAGDGCGNCYILDTKAKAHDTHPIYFLDHETDEGQADYVVASGLWAFLRFLLTGDVEREQARKRGEKYTDLWPFDARKVLAEDPMLAHYQGTVPLPWQAE